MILMKLNVIFIVLGTLIIDVVSLNANAAIGLDRTRVIFDGDKKSVSLKISNKNKTLPYLAQGWIEDEKGEKIQTPLTVLPPVQRVEPGTLSQIKIQALPSVELLPQDRETVYYFNLREIPPKSDKSNILQIALQTRIKLFYRPPTISCLSLESLTMIKQGGKYELVNPTPCYVSIKSASNRKDNQGAHDIALMVSPKSQALINISSSELGSTPTLTYINDYGGLSSLDFICSNSICNIAKEREGH